jgi:ATP-dependent RNA helicase RhlE
MLRRQTTRNVLKNFKELDLIEPLQRAIDAANYRTPTPIQAQSIPPLLEGRDLLGCAQTGTGKTAAFALPVLQKLDSELPEYPVIRALVLTPTRELAIQVADSFRTYGKHLELHGVTIYGGVSDKPQIEELEKGVDWVVATPGRLLDLMGRGHVDLSKVECFVLDEADRMLDMGFINDMRKVMKELPKRRQNLLLSATMPKSIIDLSREFLHKPVSVDIAPETPTVEKIDQSVYFVAKRSKKKLIIDLAKEESVECGIVFTRTKHGANRLTKRLNKAGIDALAIHGNKSQNARQRALKALKDGDIRLLVGTDVAARGIDVDDVTHVFNYDLPNEPEVYVHRIGRTGRAGRRGTAIAFCDSSERDYLKDIEKLIGEEMVVIDGHGYPTESEHDEPKKRSGRRSGRRKSGRKASGRNSGGRKSGGRKKSGGNKPKRRRTRPSKSGRRNA